MASQSGWRWVVLTCLVGVATSPWANAQSLNEGATPARTATVATAEEPPFWVAGVAITSERRSASLVLLDDTRRREVGVVTLREGESYGDYRLALVEPSGVQLERNGTVFSVPVGRPHAGPRGRATTAPRPIFIPGPDTPPHDPGFVPAEASRRVRQFNPGAGSGTDPNPQTVPIDLEQLFSNPMTQQTLDEMRPVIRQKLERQRQGVRNPTDVPPPASKPSGGGSQ